MFNATQIQESTVNTIGPVTALLAAAALTACQQAETPAAARQRMAAEADSVRPVIEARTAYYARIYNAAQVDSLVAIHTADALVMPPNTPAAQGSDAVRQLFTAALGQGVPGQLVLRTVGLTVNGMMAVESGRWNFVPAEGAPVPADSGKYVTRWDKVEGTWLIAEVIWNSDVPAPVPPPAPARRR
jgi:ketosteroid isomerase-like protein